MSSARPEVVRAALLALVVLCGCRGDQPPAPEVVRPAPEATPPAPASSPYVIVRADAKRLEALGVKPSAVCAAFYAGDTPAGELETSKGQVLVRAAERRDSVESVRDTVLSGAGGQRIPLTAVATIELTNSAPEHGCECELLLGQLHVCVAGGAR